MAFKLTMAVGLIPMLPVRIPDEVQVEEWTEFTQQNHRLDGAGPNLSPTNPTCHCRHLIFWIFAAQLWLDIFWNPTIHSSTYDCSDDGSTSTFKVSIQTYADRDAVLGLMLASSLLVRCRNVTR